MTAWQGTFQLSTRGECDVIDITSHVERMVHESKVRTGIVNVSGRGSTLGITTLEFESGCVTDLKRALEKVAPFEQRICPQCPLGRWQRLFPPAQRLDRHREEFPGRERGTRTRYLAADRAL